MLRPWDLLLGRVEGAVLAPVALVDLELLGLISKLGDLGCTEELLGTTALVIFKEAGDTGATGAAGTAVDFEGPVDARAVGAEGAAGAVGAAVGFGGPVDAGAMLRLEDLFDGECMAGAKGLECLAVMVNMQDLVARDNDQTAHHKQLHDVIVGT